MSADVFPRRNLPGEAEQWGRTVEQRVASVEEQERLLRQEAQAQNRSTAATLQELSRQINDLHRVIIELPVTRQATFATEGIGLSSGWNDVGDVRIHVPEGKNFANVMVNAGAAFVDTTTSGLTTSEARIQLAGQYSPIFSAAKDAGVNHVNNILTPTFGRAFPVSPSSEVYVRFQVRPLNASAFPEMPANYAVMSVMASFQTEEQ